MAEIEREKFLLKNLIDLTNKGDMDWKTSPEDDSVEISELGGIMFGLTRISQDSSMLQIINRIDNEATEIKNHTGTSALLSELSSAVRLKRGRSHLEVIEKVIERLDLSGPRKV